MRITRPNNKIKATSFDNIQEMLNYIKTTPINEVFKSKWGGLASTRKESGISNWFGTKSFDEALELMKTGWTDKSKELEEKFTKVVRQETTVTRQKSVYDVVGGNCSVPRYLQGAPTNMIRQVRKPVKEKVKTVNYNIGFNCSCTSEEITQKAIDCLSYVKQLEDSGTRVVLNVSWVTSRYDSYLGYSVCVKKSSERFSVSKMSFCLCHASMLRRIMFSLLERDPDATSDYVEGYGTSVRNKISLEKVFPDVEFFS